MTRKKTKQKKKTANKSNWWVYMLLTNQNKIYTGITTNVKNRLAEHLSGPNGAKSLKGKGPFQLLLQKKAGDRSKASSIEWYIKKLNRNEKESLIAGKLSWKSLLAGIQFRKSLKQSEKA